MQFNEDEEKMILWLCRQHAGWKTMRVIILVSAIICLCFAIFELIYNGLGASTVLYLIVGSSGLSYSLGSWSGRAEVSLLLKLIEAEKANNKSLTHHSTGTPNGAP